MNNNKFWRLQKAANLTNSQCAKWLGVTPRNISRWRVSDSRDLAVLALAYRVKYGDIDVDQVLKEVQSENK